MRLYLSPKEAQLVYMSLTLQRITMSPDKQLMCDAIQDRISLCDKLHRSESKAKEDKEK